MFHLGVTSMNGLCDIYCLSCAGLTPSCDRNNKIEIDLFSVAPCHTFSMIRGPPSLEPITDHWYSCREATE